MKEIDEEENNENEKSIERTRLINNEVKKTFMSPEENAFLELLSIVLGT